ncbi:MAG: hypothetical protein V7K64_30945 [Nostoc sp.]|nr:hypothetical protein [Nostoc sp. JL34]MBN3885191.1 hypothetical protein [Nostoc sp. JL34]
MQNFLKIIRYFQDRFNIHCVVAITSTTAVYHINRLRKSELLHLITKAG